jgi:hypothetical protein
MAGSRDAITKQLAERLAHKIARFFYDHQLGELEREE